MNQEIKPEQALMHLAQLALEASVPDKTHTVSKKCFEILKKLIEENVKAE